MGHEQPRKTHRCAQLPGFRAPLLRERDSFAEIDLGALRANYRALSAYTNGASIMAVVKADAYGHGAVEVVRALRKEGCAHFGVATVEEAEH